MFVCDYFVEILTPKRTDPSSAKALLNTFAERYCRILDMQLGMSIPDNPMGQPRFGLLETCEPLSLPITPEHTIMNLNTFHTKDELDGILKKADQAGLKYILVVRGDGGPKLSKIDPQSIGGSKSVATSMDLLHYIHREYPGRFTTGCAFNHYNPMPYESDRLRKKIDAGAAFVITQPVIEKDRHLDAILELGIPVVVEAWMSKNLELLLKSVGQQKEDGPIDYDPIKNLHALHHKYPENSIYLSMLAFKKQWRSLLPKLSPL
jgi:methylenetetrahydrofolate reductase (NADPH)